MNENDKAKVIAARMRDWDDAASHGLDEPSRIRARRNFVALVRKYPGIAESVPLHSVNNDTHDTIPGVKPKQDSE